MSRAAELTEIISTSEKRIELADALTRLNRSHDFKLIRDAIFKDEVHKTVESLSRVGLDTPEHKQLVRRMDAISVMQSMLGEVISSAAFAREDVRQARRYLGEMDED